MEEKERKEERKSDSEREREIAAETGRREDQK